MQVAFAGHFFECLKDAVPAEWCGSEMPYGWLRIIILMDCICEQRQWRFWCVLA